MNPSDGAKYNGLKEFPRSRYTAEFKNQDWIVASVKFQLTVEDVTELESLQKQETLIVTKTYSGKTQYQFEPGFDSPNVSKNDYLKIIQSWYAEIKKSVAPENKGDIFNPIKNELLSHIESMITKLKEDNSKNMNPDNIMDLDNLLNEKINEDWIEEKLGKLKEDSQKFVDIVNRKKSTDADITSIAKLIPQFIYFDKYDILYGSVNLNEFHAKYTVDSNDPKLRITKCLFEHVGIDIPDLISRLDISDGKEREKAMEEIILERYAIMDSAGQEMTRQFQDWWPQRRHTFRYALDHKQFTVFVSDDLDPSGIELTERSQGLQYFFSFFLTFLVEAKNTHKDSILLLDEPGLYYHGTAQQKTVEFLKKLSSENQLLYTTHSPFMIDGEHLENARIVYEDKKYKTRVTSDVWPKDKEAIFPLQAGLGYNIAQTLFYAKHNLVVEGITDYLLMKAMNELLIRKKMIKLDDKIVIVPAGGAKNIILLSSLFTSQDINVFVILDGDKVGRDYKKKLSDKMLINAALVSDFTNIVNAEIEDLFEQDTYLKSVSMAYPSVSLDFNSKEKNIPNIVDKVTALFDRKDKSFEKWEVAYKLIQIIQETSSNSISQDTCNKFENIFNRVNTDFFSNDV